MAFQLKAVTAALPCSTYIDIYSAVVWVLRRRTRIAFSGLAALIGF
jgi:hypothetical protein